MKDNAEARLRAAAQGFRKAGNMSLDDDAENYAALVADGRCVGDGFEFSGKQLNEPYEEFRNILSQAIIAMLIIGGIRYFSPNSMSEVAAGLLWAAATGYGALALLAHHMRGAVAHRRAVEFQLHAMQKEIAKSAYFARRTALNSNSDPEA